MAESDRNNQRFTIQETTSSLFLAKRWERAVVFGTLSIRTLASSRRHTPSGFVLFRLLLREQVVYAFSRSRIPSFQSAVPRQVRFFRAIRMLFNLNKVIKTGAMV